MKTNVILIMCLVFALGTFAQTETDFDIAEISVSPPKFTGEKYVQPIDVDPSKSITAYIAANIVYPERSIDQLREGTEVVQFIVNADGTVDNFTVVNSVSEEIDNAVIMALKETSGLWKPGTNNGVPTAMAKEVSLLFKIDEDNPSVIVNNFLKKARHYFTAASESLFFEKNTKKALRKYNRAFNYLPNDENILLMRGLCKYELGDEKGAERDWGRIKMLARNGDKENNLEMHAQFVPEELKGYHAMQNMLK